MDLSLVWGFVTLSELVLLAPAPPANQQRAQLDPLCRLVDLYLFSHKIFLALIFFWGGGFGKQTQSGSRCNFRLSGSLICVADRTEV